MIRISLQVALALAVAFGLGTWSVQSALDSRIGRQTLVVDGWVADTASGRPDGANPYSRARASRQPLLPLGIAEGLVFRRGSDDAGRPLSLSCSYRIEGPVPPSRFWTVHAQGSDQRVGHPAAALHSLALLRTGDNAFAVDVGRHPVSGNWLAVDGDGSFSLVLTLYDTPIASSTALTEIDLPSVVRGGCDA